MAHATKFESPKKSIKTMMLPNDVTSAGLAAKAVDVTPSAVREVIVRKKEELTQFTKTQALNEALENANRALALRQPTFQQLFETAKEIEFVKITALSLNESTEILAASLKANSKIIESFNACTKISSPYSINLKMLSTSSMNTNLVATLNRNKELLNIIDKNQKALSSIVVNTNSINSINLKNDLTLSVSKINDIVNSISIIQRKTDEIKSEQITQDYLTHVRSLMKAKNDARALLIKSESKINEMKKGKLLAYKVTQPFWKKIIHFLLSKNEDFYRDALNKAITEAVHKVNIELHKNNK